MYTKIKRRRRLRKNKRDLTNSDTTTLNWRKRPLSQFLNLSTGTGTKPWRRDRLTHSTRTCWSRNHSKSLKSTTWTLRKIESLRRSPTTSEETEFSPTGLISDRPKWMMSMICHCCREFTLAGYSTPLTASSRGRYSPDISSIGTQSLCQKLSRLGVTTCSRRASLICTHKRGSPAKSRSTKTWKDSPLIKKLEKKEVWLKTAACTLSHQTKQRLMSTIHP